MPRHADQLLDDAQRIWRAGVQAVLPSALIRAHVRCHGDDLELGDRHIDLGQVGRIAIVGAGKAGGAMAAALEEALGPRLLEEKQVTGWVNVPADCIVPIRRVHLHAGRPPGVNEPRPEGVEGTRRILELIGALTPDDLCLCVIAGGGSALLPAPVPEITLDDKIRLTRRLSAAGANIQQLNAVRRQLSLVKGGGLARVCRAGRLVSLIISDVPGDPLDVIASGPTVYSPAAASQALAVLDELGLRDNPSLDSAVRYLVGRERAEQDNRSPSGGTVDAPIFSEVTNQIIGNNALAVDSAGQEAERLGYSHAMISVTSPEGDAEGVGIHLARLAQRMRSEPGPDCLISGGEPTVTLADPSIRGLGGRNQHLALAALADLGDCAGVALLAGGTDGEDGPTDAAGAFVTEKVVVEARQRGLSPPDYLRRSDAYHFFQEAGGLFITGPTQTNVCDLRVITVDRSYG